MKMIRKFLSSLLAALLAFTPPLAYPAFDPVNDDTDIFLANPSITANRPNVLIALDNTANWNTPFVNEKSALVQVVNNLSDAFNVGLMMMPETGSPNDNTDGGYVRFHVRQMTLANKTALASVVNNFDILNDKGNNATHGAMLYEAYLYYAGLAAASGDGKLKTDHDGTTDALLTPLTGHALPGPDPSKPQLPLNNGVYRSPIVDGCQKNFIILISNGPADNNSTELAGVESKLGTLTGVTPPAQIAVTPNGRQGNWADEMAKYMANADVNASLTNAQNVITYVVEVNPGTTGQGPDWTAVMKSTATNGNGKYFAVTDDASGAAIVDALNAIFAEIQAVNSVFASSSLPVSVSVRGSFLNQLYVGVFRPDAVKSPRWMGNLKLYAFDQDPSTGAVFLVDANGNSAVNPATNFISPSARSFWSQSSSYWGFRDVSQNGVGGANDIPDGEIVEKGGAGQQIRLAYPNAENGGAAPQRNVYTCTTGDVNGTPQTCTANSPLLNTPFIDGNAGITTALLQLGTRLVSPLTGFATKAVSSLTDRRSVSLTNADPSGGVSSVTSLTNGATQATITDLRTSTPKVVSSLSGATTGTVTVTLTNLAKVAGQWTVTTGAGLSGVTAGTVFTINCTGGSAADIAAINGLTATQRTVTTVNSTTSYVINGPSSGNPTCTAGTVGGPGLVPTSTITVNLPSHGFTAGTSVTIAGAGTYTNVNGTFNIASTPTTDTFTYLLPSGTAGLATGTITASSNTTTAIASSNAHGLGTAGSTVNLTIYGANPTGYNGSVSAFIIDANSFRYTVGTALSPNTASPVYAMGCAVTCTTVTASAAGHAFTDGSLVTISGATIPEYNGTFTISGTVPGVSFQYPTATVLPATGGTIVASSGSGTLATVTATLTGHGFNVGDSITIESTSSPADANHPGTYSVLTVPDGNTFTYSTGVARPAPTGGFTARSITNPLAFAAVTGHGYTDGDPILIAGATPAGYNGTKTITVVDANTFTYSIAAGLGANTGSSVTSSIATNTARATSVAHGFSNGDTVTIAGANIADFNGTFTIGNVTTNTFEYTIATKQGDATGTITAAGVASTDRASLIKWVRGEDNFSDENVNGSTTDIRSSVHGDVLHSSPVVINYNRYLTAGGQTSNNDVYVFYGGGDSVFHAVKGGYATETTATNQIQPGYEAWGFIPTEFFGQLNRLRTNAPTISSSFKKPYFADGPIGVYTKDANNNGKLGDLSGGANVDTVNLYITMRRGGRLIYALDVNDPHNPKFLWKIDSGTAGFSELGQTWSQPRVVESLAGLPYPVIVFGGGYDPSVEDIDPATITASDATSVTTAAGSVNRSMGRAIYVVNALTGALLWSVGGSNSAGTFTSVVPDMDFAIPSDLAVIANQSGGPVNRAYVGDTGGNMWRIDFRRDTVTNSLAASMVTKLAAVGAHTASGRRKFFYPPSITSIDNVDSVLIGSGDREHPFDTTVTNRFYMFKDMGGDLGPVTGDVTTTPALSPAGTNAVITEATLFDATANCVQDCTGAAQATAISNLDSSTGWYITLASGEKVVGNPVTAAGTTVFSTNQPDAGAGGGTCGSNLGIARLYQVNPADATATKDVNTSGGLTGADRSQVLAGGGFVPRGDYRAIDLSTGPGADPGGGDKPKVVECVVTGFKCTSPGGPSLNARLRKYWFKTIDQ